MQPTLGQLIMSINGALLALQGGIILIADVPTWVTAVVVLGCSIGIAFLNPFLPKVSMVIRRSMGLRE